MEKTINHEQTGGEAMNRFEGMDPAVATIIARTQLKMAAERERDRAAFFGFGTRLYQLETDAIVADLDELTAPKPDDAQAPENGKKPREVR